MTDNDDNEDISIKVVLLGETAVGKTSIITRFIRNSFSPYVMSTSGASFVTEIIELDNNKKVKVNIWDTAGQERYRSVSKIIYKNASVVILVYDITNIISFEGIRDYWSKEIKDNCPENVTVAVVANKSDNYLEQKVPIEDGKELAEKLNAIFASTSAKLGNGIDDLFRTVTAKHLNLEKDNTCSNEEEMKENNKKITIEKNKNTKNTGKKKKCC